MPGFFDTWGGGFGGFDTALGPSGERRLMLEAAKREQELKMRALEGAMQTSKDLEQNYGRFSTQGFSPSGFGQGSLTLPPTRPGMMDTSNDRQRTALALEALQNAFKPAADATQFIGLRGTPTQRPDMGALDIAPIPSQSKEEERKQMLKRLIEERMTWGGGL